MDITLAPGLPVLPSYCQPALPYEVLHIVLDFYIEGRALDVERARDHLGPADYPIVPILRVSRWFHGTTIPLLYKDVSLKRGVSINRFLSEPNVHSYHHVKRLEIANAYRASIDTIVQRLNQIMMMWIAIEKKSPDALSSSLYDYDKIFKQWIERRPKISLRMTGNDAFALGSSFSLM